MVTGLLCSYAKSRSFAKDSNCSWSFETFGAEISGQTFSSLSKMSFVQGMINDMVAYIQPDHMPSTGTSNNRTAQYLGNTAGGVGFPI